MDYDLAFGASSATSTGIPYFPSDARVVGSLGIRTTRGVAVAVLAGLAYAAIGAVNSVGSH